MLLHVEPVEPERQILIQFTNGTQLPVVMACRLPPRKEELLSLDPFPLPGVRQEVQGRMAPEQGTEPMALLALPSLSFTIRPWFTVPTRAEAAMEVIVSRSRTLRAVLAVQGVAVRVLEAALVRA